MDRREVLQRPAGQRAVQLAQRLGRRQRLGALDQGALELPAKVPLELAQPVLGDAVGIRKLTSRRLPLQLEGPPDPLQVHPDHPRSLALAPEGGDREPRHVPHLAVRPLAHGLADALAQVLEVQAVATAVALLREPPLDRLALHGAEEEAVEDDLEYPPVLLRLGERGRERLRSEERRVGTE